MDLFIRIQDGQPFEHPIFGDNFRQAFPEIDTENLPEGFARFERVLCPNAAGVYEVDYCTYEWVDGVVKDVWRVRPMTDEEKAAKQQLVKDWWAQHGYASWTFDEEACMFVPPVPYPNDGTPYHWHEEALSWEPGGVLLPPSPAV